MYIPEHFEVTDREEIFSFIEVNAFGQLISLVDERFFSTHLPFLVSEDRSKLVCHLAKQNPQWETIDGQEVLVTFQGPHDYISPQWYRSPGVPTWNYQAVHVYGICEPFHDPGKLKNIVDTLTEKYEATFKNPWVPTYREQMLQAIVGVEIEITDIQCQYKLNQNRSKKDQINVTEQLDALGSKQLSQAMRNNESSQS